MEGVLVEVQGKLTDKCIREVFVYTQKQIFAFKCVM